MEIIDKTTWDRRELFDLISAAMQRNRAKRRRDLWIRKKRATD